MLTPAAQATLAGLTYDDDGDPLTPPVSPTTFHLQRSSIDLRPNNNANEAETNMIRLVGGLQGDFEVANRFFNWDVSYNFGRSATDTKSVEISSERFFYALDVVDDGNGGLGCRVVVDPASRPVDPGDPFGTQLPGQRFDDCVPLDIFGNGRPSPEAIRYIAANSTSKTVLQQQVLEANIGGELFDLPAGALGGALGVSHREESGDFQVDGFSQLGLGRSVPVEPVFGEYEVDEFYAEFFAPIISEDMGIPLVQALSIEGAYRFLDNSLAGTDDVWTIGGRAPPPETQLLKRVVGFGPSFTKR